MNKMKRSMLLLATTVLVLATALAGCGGSKSESSDPAPSTSSNNDNKSSDNGEKKEASGEKWELGAKPLGFSLYSHYDGIDFPVWDSTPAGKWLKENKQVDIKMISAGGNKAQKMSAMIASDELPDVIWGDRNDADTERLREAGKLVAFDDYLDKYPNLKTWMGDLNMLRADDGKLYQFPNWYTGRPYGNAGYAINKKIYEELGSPKLETTDDLYDYLKQVKAKYGDGIVPFEPHMAKDAQGLGVLYTAFGEGALYTSLNNQLLSVPKGDKLTSLFTDPVFREANKYIAKLYREKLISQEAFNQTEDQVKEKVMSGRVAVYAGASPTTFAMEADAALTKKDPNAGYFMIWPIHKPGLDKDKIYPGTYTSLGWNVSVITTAAKDPEAIFAFLDWYTGPEGQNLLFFGPEGGNWKGFDAEGKPNFTDNYNAEAVAKIQADNDPIMINGNTSYIDPAKMKYEMSLPAEKQNWSARYQGTITWPTQYNVTEFINLNPAPDSELGIAKQAVTDLFLEVYAKMIINSKSDEDVDKILDKAEADAQKLGYDKLLEFRTERWQANKAKLSGK